MENKKRVFLVGLTLLALAALSGCHGGAGSTYKVRWVNEADSKKVMELTLQSPSVAARLHMAVFRGRVRGTYILKDGDKATEGLVTQREDGYRLTSQDGTEQMFTVERSTGEVKDESGATWKPDNSAPKVTLKEWGAAVEQRQP